MHFGPWQGHPWQQSPRRRRCSYINIYVCVGTLRAAVYGGVCHRGGGREGRGGGWRGGGWRGWNEAYSGREGTYDIIGSLHDVVNRMIYDGMWSSHDLQTAVNIIMDTIWRSSEAIREKNKYIHVTTIVCRVVSYRLINLTFVSDSIRTIKSIVWFWEEFPKVDLSIQMPRYSSCILIIPFKYRRWFVSFYYCTKRSYVSYLYMYIIKSTTKK